MLKKILLSIFSLLFIASVIPAEDIDKIKINIPDRPDIVVEKMRLTKLPSLERGKVRLKIEVWVSNNSTKPTRCCPTQAGVNWWKQYPPDNKLFRIVVSCKYGNTFAFRVARTSTELGPNIKNARYQFVGTFESKGKLSIRVAADPGNWINEKNENNNMKQMYWPLMVKKVN